MVLRCCLAAVQTGRPAPQPWSPRTAPRSHLAGLSVPFSRFPNPAQRSAPHRLPRSSSETHGDLRGPWKVGEPTAWVQNPEGLATRCPRVLPFFQMWGPRTLQARCLLWMSYYVYYGCPTTSAVDVPPGPRPMSLLSLRILRPSLPPKMMVPRDLKAGHAGKESLDLGACGWWELGALEGKGGAGKRQEGGEAERRDGWGEASLHPSSP